MVLKVIYFCQRTYKHFIMEMEWEPKKKNYLTTIIFKKFKILFLIA